jgi:L-asparaginase
MDQALEHHAYVPHTPSARVELASSAPTVGCARKAETRHILVVYVGGTLGMKPNHENSLAPVAGYLTTEMRRMRELNPPPSDELTQGSSSNITITTISNEMRVPTFDVIEYAELLDSSDMDQQDWLVIARDIERYYYLYDGFLIAHGTDTMHYTATALSFLLHNLAKPVILTGAMVPLMEPYNDARRNLVVGMMFAASTEICEVCIFCNDVLLRGNRSVKVRHTLSAFSSPNYPALSVMEAQPFGARRHLLARPPTGPLAIHSDMSGRVMTVLCHPDFDAESVRSMIQGTGKADNRLDCVVLELMGVGNTTSTMAKTLQSVVDTATRVGCLVAITTQDLYGSLTAASASRLRKLCPDAIFVGDMTTEAAAVKAMYLFGKKLTSAEVKEWMPRNIRGEVTTVASRL